MNFVSRPRSIVPINRTPIAKRLKKMGLCPFIDEPVINGSMNIASVNADYMNYGQVDSWSSRMSKTGKN
jgi:hypothetical protein